MPQNNLPNTQYESGHAKNLESWIKLEAFSQTLDQLVLNPPVELTLAALAAVTTNAQELQQNVADSKANWRTVALDRHLEVDKFETIASQAVGQLAGRGASKESVEDARGYVRKLQGKGSKAKKKDDPSTPDIDESETGVSNSQQSNAAKIAIFFELIDFLEAQTVYATVTAPGLTIADLRALADAAQAKHELSITAAADLTAARIERNKVFYLIPKTNLIDLAAQFKELVKGSFGGAGSPEYKAVNAIKFKKPKL